MKNLKQHLEKLQEKVNSDTLAIAGLQDYQDDGYWDWHIADDYEYMSPKFWDILGYDYKTKDQHPSEWMALIFPEDLDATMVLFQNHVDSKGKTPFDCTVRYFHGITGKTLHLQCRGKVVEWSDTGEPIRAVGIHQLLPEKG